MKENRATELGAAAARASCPYCEHRGLEFTLRCDLGFGPCLFTARCNQCNASMEIVVSESVLDPAHLAGTIGPCADCGEARRIATLSCSEATRECVYRVECPGCGDKART